MKKICLLLINYALVINASNPGKTPEFCQRQFDASVTAVLRTLVKSVRPEEIQLAEAYIREVKKRELFDAQILVLERTTLIDPRVQGILKKPYDNYSDCIRLNLLFPQETRLVECENKYILDVQNALSTYAQNLNMRNDLNDVQRAALFQDAKKYIELYRERGETNNKLHLFGQQTILNVKPLEGLLRKPYDIYDQCKDPASLIPLNFRR